MEKDRNVIIERARQRRIREKRRKAARLAAALIAVILIGNFALSIRSFANERNGEAASYKYYRTYTVESGDSLRRIAKENMSEHYSSVDKYVSEVVSINHIVSASDIYTGQTLIIPYYSSEVK